MIESNGSKPDADDSEGFIELERYELFEAAGYSFQFGRREFMKVFGGGLALIVPVCNVLGQQTQGQQGGESGRGGFNERLPNDIGAWIHIDEDGGVKVFTGKTEMGQNIRTSLTQAVAEELHVPLSMIHLIMADTHLTPFDMGTFGSRTTPTMAPQLRKAAAAAREALIDLAAQQWHVDRSSIVVADGKVTDREGNQSAWFGELTRGQKL